MLLDRPPKVADAVVLGAGVTGLVSAKILLDQGCQDVVVIDEYGKLGGNHINVEIPPFTYDVGTFIFQDDSPLLAHFPELLPLYQPVEQLIHRVRPDGKIVDYPYSVRADIIEKGPLEWLRLASSLLIARFVRPKPADAETYSRYWLGDRFFRTSGLYSYIRRFYGVPPSTVELTFADKRMGFSRTASIGHALMRQITRAPFNPPNQSLVRPRAGFQALYGKALESLEARGAKVLLGVKVESLARVDGGFRLSLPDGETLYAGRLICTIPIDIMLGLMGEPQERPLPTLSLTSLFYSFKGQRKFTRPILYNFTDNGDWKRITMYSDFYGPADGREYFGVEVVNRGDPKSPAVLDKDFRDHCAGLSLFEGDLVLEGSHYLPHAYPVYTKGVTEDAAAKIARLRALGVETFGRQGGFDYQPTARVSTLVAESSLGGVAAGPTDPSTVFSEA